MTLLNLGQSALLAVILCFGMGCPASACITEPDARIVAAKRLDEYTEREKLDVANFPPAETQQTDDGWAFNFSSTSMPRHLVTVIVHCDGGSEVSRLIEP